LKRHYEDDENELADASNNKTHANKKARVDSSTSKKAIPVPVAKRAAAAHKVSS
jgi:hypothetical protein